MEQQAVRYHLLCGRQGACELCIWWTPSIESIRSALMIEISERIKEQDLTQTQAAKILHITQPRASALLKGKINEFRLDSLNLANQIQGNRPTLLIILRLLPFSRIRGKH